MTMPNNPPTLRPPAWAEKYRWHWLSGSDGLSLWEWKPDVDVWLTTETDAPIPPHWFTPDVRYSHPADPSARVIDPDDEAMVECVARGIRSQKLRRVKKPNIIPEIMIPHITDDEWRLDVDLARAALSAQKEAK